MDTVTQIVLGATIGEAGFRKKLGRRSVFFAAFCGWFPDIDVFFHQFGSWESVVSHRAESHSLFILPLIALPLGYIGHKWGKKGSAWQWIQLSFWALITHPLLDTFTSYGTQLLAPFSDARFAWDAVAIIDLIYTAPLLWATFWALQKRRDRQQSKKFATKALAFSTLYLAIGFAMSQYAIAQAKTIFARDDFAVKTIKANCVIFSPLLRRVTAIDGKGNLITTTVGPFLKDPPINYHSHPQNEQLQSLLESEAGKIFLWFTEGFYSVHQKDDTIQLFDAKYGYTTEPWKSFFMAETKIEADGGLSPLQQKMWREIEASEELRRNWKMMWGL